MSDRLPPETGMGPVGLRVGDLARSLGFYVDDLGLELLDQSGGRARLGAGGRTLLELREIPGAPAQPRGTAGLYHFALLVPDRARLGWALRRLIERRIQLQGAADHWVSEAIYLPDPDGNGIEIYRDRPRQDWPMVDEQLQMGTDPLNVEAVLAAGEGQSGAALPSGTVVGHVHLHVANLVEAEGFYGPAVGLERMVGIGGHAAFYAAGGYHHHLGLNTWAGVGAAPPPETAAGLDWFTINVPDSAAVEAAADRLRKAEAQIEATGAGWQVTDPSGTRLRLVKEEPSA